MGGSTLIHDILCQNFTPALNFFTLPALPCFNISVLNIYHSPTSTTSDISMFSCLPVFGENVWQHRINYIFIDGEKRKIGFPSQIQTLPCRWLKRFSNTLAYLTLPFGLSSPSTGEHCPLQKYLKFTK